MRNSVFYIVLLLSCTLYAQESDSLSIENERELVVLDTIAKEAYEPLAPARAAFYSAVLPGLGQAYNKKYWKIPIVYAGIGTGLYFYTTNQDEYNRFRDAFKSRLAGFENDEFQGVSTARLIDAQRTAARNRDTSLVVAIVFYVLNIIDANVDAHLRQYNVSNDLSIEPTFQMDDVLARPSYGMSLQFKLK